MLFLLVKYLSFDCMEPVLLSKGQYLHSLLWHLLSYLGFVGLVVLGSGWVFALVRMSFRLGSLRSAGTSVWLWSLRVCVDLPRTSQLLRTMWAKPRYPGWYCVINVIGCPDWVVCFFVRMLSHCVLSTLAMVVAKS